MVLWLWFLFAFLFSYGLWYVLNDYITQAEERSEWDEYLAALGRAVERGREGSQ